jgi:hypothetical protein
VALDGDVFPRRGNDLGRRTKGGVSAGALRGFDARMKGQFELAISLRVSDLGRRVGKGLTGVSSGWTGNRIASGAEPQSVGPVEARRRLGEMLSFFRRRAA